MMQGTVDVDRALALLTERQHLNQVHFVVALVRKALAAGARSVVITSRKSQLRMVWDAPLDPAEVDDLQRVMHPSSTSDDKLAALARLEEQHGLTLLSLCRAHDVRVDGPVAFASSSGQLRLGQAVSGPTTIDLQRKKGRPKDERAELAFYAAHADAEVRFNRKLLTSSLAFAPSETLAHVRQNDVEAWVRLSSTAEAGELKYYKHGVYFGVAKREQWPLPFEVRINSRTLGVEQNFGASIRRAHQLEQELVPAALAQWVQQVERMPARRRRAQSLRLLRMRPSMFSTTCSAAPLVWCGGDRWSSVDALVASAVGGDVPPAVRAALSSTVAAAVEPHLRWRQVRLGMGKEAWAAPAVARVAAPEDDATDAERVLLARLQSMVDVPLLLGPAAGQTDDGAVVIARAHPAWLQACSTTDMHKLRLLAHVLAWPGDPAPKGAQPR